MSPSPAQASQRPPFTLNENRPRRSTDRRLVDVDDLVDQLPADDVVMLPRRFLGAVQPLSKGAEQRVDDQRALARARDAGHTRDGTELDVDVQILEVVMPGALDR